MPYRNLILSLAMALILIVFGLGAGCLQSPSDGGRSFSSIPEVILDYEHDTSCFKIYVKSAVGDYKYQYIWISVDGNESLENNTYVMSLKCADDEFTMEIEASVDEETIYHTDLDVSIGEDEEKNIIINIIDSTDIKEEEIEILLEDLPWKKILVLKE